jgi:chromosome segregation ATPase
MEQQPVPASPEGNPRESWSELLAQRRQRVRDFVGAHRERLESLETALSQQLARIEHELATDRETASRALDDIESRRQELTSAACGFEEAEKAIQAAAANLERQKQEWAQTHAAQSQALDDNRARLAEARSSLDRDLAAHQAAQARWQAQRRRLAGTLGRRRAALQQSVHRRSEQQALAAQWQAERESLQARLAERTAGEENCRREVEETRAQRDEAQSRFAGIQEEVSQLSQQLLRAREEQDATARRLAEESSRLGQVAVERDDLAGRVATLTTSEQRLLEQETLLRAEREDLAARLEAQGRQSAAELGSLQAQLAAALEARGQLVENQAGASAALDQARQELASCQADLAAARHAEHDAAQRLEAECGQTRDAQERLRTLEADVEAWRGRYEALRSERDELQRRLEQADQRRASADAAALHEAIAQLDRAQARIVELEAQLQEREAAAAAAQAGDLDLAQQLEDLKRRYDLALEDTRELNRRNAELEKSLQQAPPPAAPNSSETGWEAQKRRLLASLEADADDESESADEREERLKIHDVVKKTDAVVAAKNNEIAELQRLLDEQSSNIGTVAVGAAALGGILDQDEIIQQERNRLTQLQKEWEDKLRQAEVEISMQRAQLAREKVRLEDLQRAVEQLGSSEPADEKRKKSARGWRAMLGLGDDR